MTGRKPTLSLLIPAYNAAWCLPRLLKSAQAQTIPFDEIWVYDDCSTDNTAEVAAQYGAKVLRGTVNKGCSAGKNALAQHVETDWMHFHDADDELLPSFVERAHSWMERDDLDVVLFSYEWRDNETHQLLAVNHFDDAKLKSDPRKYTIFKQINPFCGLYRRDTFIRVGGYDEEKSILYNEDVDFHIKLAFYDIKFRADNEICIVNYRIKNSMSANNQGKCAVSHYHVMKRTLGYTEGLKYKQEIGANLWKVSSVLAALNEWHFARLAVELAASLCPPPLETGKRWFRLLARHAPYRAVQLREIAIRLLKPRT
jgi:glycosyltransferase involved in cell wall biosynthesis